MRDSPLRLIEFPADEPERARRFWEELLGVTLQPRSAEDGEGWQSPDAAFGLHPRGRGPGDTWSLPYFEVGDMDAALARVGELGGQVIHPGERWSVCKDSEGTPFGLTIRAG